MDRFKPLEIALSPHLFWDVNRSNLDWKNNSVFIIKRVLEYGLWEDCKIIAKRYGLDFIAMKAQGFRELDPKALNFITTIEHLPLTTFRCYTTAQH